MIFQHYSQVPDGLWRWENFAPDEPLLACPCCGEFVLDEIAMDRLQAVRTTLGRPLRINSGHRCLIHNARVGGAPLSRHKHIAFDIRLAGHDRYDLYGACRQAGFSGFGFYQNFLHVDTGRGRFWLGQGAKDLWNWARLREVC